MLPHFITVAGLAAGAVAGAVPSDVAVRNAPGMSETETVHAVYRRLNQIRQSGEQSVFNESTTLNATFENAVLLQVGASNTTDPNIVTDEDDSSGLEESLTVEGALEIFCNTCYIKGIAHASLTVGGALDVEAAFGNLTEQFGDTIDNITDAVTEFYKEIWAEVTDFVETGDFDIPPLDIDLEGIDVPEMPDVTLTFGFDELDLLVDLDLTLSAGAEYKLNLYTSQGPFGFRLGEDLLVGVVFSVDLILSVDAEVTLGTGFHLQLDDGFVIELAMFAEEVANLEVTGGQFEFLPVTVETEGIVLEALLSLGIYSGFTMQTPSDLSGVGIPSAGGGIEVSVYANLAQLTTNITIPALLPSDGEEDDDSEDAEEDCLLRVVQEFEIGLGAAAGASVFLGDQTWGPVPSTYTPIFYTTLADICAFAPEPTPTIAARQNNDDEDEEDESTTTTETEKVFTGTECLSTGLLNCPNSLQSVHKYTVVETLTATTTEGEEIDWDSFVAASTGPARVREFGQNALALTATSGQPVSYVPPPPTPTAEDGEESDGDDEDGEDGGGVSTGVIVGASVGGGVALLLIVSLIVFFVIKRRRNRTAMGSTIVYNPTPDMHEPLSNKKVTRVDAVYRR